MKLMIFFLFVACMHAGARTGAQGLTLHEKNASLEKVFAEITRQTSYRFFYSETVLAKAAKVTIVVENKSLEEVLKLCFQNQPLQYSIVGKTIVVKEKLPSLNELTGLVPEQPPIDVRGKIVNEKGEPVVASVLVKGTNKGVTSNENGEFELKNVDETATLIISGVTIETYEMKAKSDLGIVRVKMKVSAMEGVEVLVNTGYQKIPKERATGSFVQINNELYNQQVGTNVIDRLQYISNGVTAFPKMFSGQIMVRGLSTLTTLISKPLIILDNFIYTGDINNLNPNDIENVSILKDASAGSIWGAQAANGVIVLTTKKGQYNRKVKIDVNSNVTITGKPDLFYLKTISSSDFVELEKDLYSKGYYDAQTPYPQFFALSPVINILEKQRLGLISASEATVMINSIKTRDVRSQFDQYFYTKAYNQQYSISASGGGNNLAWILSANMDKNLSSLSVSFDRINLRFGNSYKLNDKIEITSDFFFTNSKSASGKPGYGGVLMSNGIIPPYTQFADDNGTKLPLYIKYNQTFIDTLGNGRLLDWRYYPLDDYKHVRTNSMTTDLTSMMGLKYKMLPFLSIDVKYRYERQIVESSKLQDKESYYTRDLVNTFSQLNYSTGTVTYKIPKGDILDQSHQTLVGQNFRTQLNFDKRWNRNNLAAILGCEISETKTNGNNYRTYGYNGDNLTTANVDYVNPYPHIVNGGQNLIPNFAGFSKTNKRFVSFYSNAAYTLLDKYTLSASARRDASNLFGVNINDKWKPLWSVGASWNISKEDFYHSALLPHLQFKVTYGQQGNVDPSKVGLTTIEYSGNNSFTVTPYSVVRNYENPNLKWEQVAMLNAAIDFASGNRRLSGSIEFYTKKSSDLYGTSPIDVTTGLGRTVLKNFGELKGHGLDINLNYAILQGNFKWMTNLIFNTYHDRITKLNDPSNLFAKDVVGGSGFKAVQGGAPFSYYAYQWGGLDPLTGDPLGYLNGNLSKDYASITNTGSGFGDAVYVGRLIAPVFGSFANTFQWKGFSATFRFIYKFGYYFQRQSINYSYLVSNNEGHSDYHLRWQKPGDEAFTNVPSFVYPVSTARESFYQNAEVLATKADYIRLQYVTFSYDWVRGTRKKVPLERIQFYCNINNLGLVWRANDFNIDPEYNNSIPEPRNFAIGLRATF